MSIPKVGRVKQLDHLRSGWYNGFELCLFENDFEPDADSVSGDFTEPTWAGYTRLALNTWGDVALTADGHALSSNDPVSWTKTDMATAAVFGIFILDPDGFLWAYERFDPAPVIVEQFVPLTRTITVGDTSEF